MKAAQNIAALKRVGWSLVALSMLLALWTLSNMAFTYSEAAGSESASATSIAERLQSALEPMMVGGPALIFGLILLLVCWWQSRKLQRSTVC